MPLAHFVRPRAHSASAPVARVSYSQPCVPHWFTPPGAPNCEVQPFQLVKSGVTGQLLSSTLPAGRRYVVRHVSPRQRRGTSAGSSSVSPARGKGVVAGTAHSSRPRSREPSPCSPPPAIPDLSVAFPEAFTGDVVCEVRIAQASLAPSLAIRDFAATVTFGKQSRVNSELGSDQPYKFIMWSDDLSNLTASERFLHVRVHPKPGSIYARCVPLEFETSFPLPDTVSGTIDKHQLGLVATGSGVSLSSIYSYTTKGREQALGMHAGYIQVQCELRKANCDPPDGASSEMSSPLTRHAGLSGSILGKRSEGFPTQQAATMHTLSSQEVSARKPSLGMASEGGQSARTLLPDAASRSGSKDATLLRDELLVAGWKPESQENRTEIPTDVFIDSFLREATNGLSPVPSCDVERQRTGEFESLVQGYQAMAVKAEYELRKAAGDPPEGLKSQLSFARTRQAALSGILGKRSEGFSMKPAVTMQTLSSQEIPARRSVMLPEVDAAQLRDELVIAGRKLESQEARIEFLTSFFAEASARKATNGVCTVPSCELERQRAGAFESIVLEEYQALADKVREIEIDRDEARSEVAELRGLLNVEDACASDKLQRRGKPDRIAVLEESPFHRTEMSAALEEERIHRELFFKQYSEEMHEALAVREEQILLLEATLDERQNELTAVRLCGQITQRASSRAESLSPRRSEDLETLSHPPAFAMDSFGVQIDQNLPFAKGDSSAVVNNEQPFASGNESGTAATPTAAGAPASGNRLARAGFDVRS